MMHSIYPFALELWPETNEFKLRYNIGLFVFQSGKCGSFTDDNHFNKFIRQFSRYVSDIRYTEEEINAENLARNNKEHL